MKKRERRRKRWPWWAVATLVLLLSPATTSASAGAVGVVPPGTLNFSAPETETPRFNHLVVHRNTGRVYVGAVNRLYQLLPTLELEETMVTGPKDDSPLCPVTRDCPTTPTKPTDNVNKVLVIDYMEGRLITCGSIYQGLCIIHRLHNVSRSEPVNNEPVAANNGTASTVAFIAPGPPNPPTTHVLYVAVSFTANGPYRTELPAVCSRSLDPARMLSIASISVSSGTRMLVNTLARERYPINYVFGFASRGFSYFLTTQKKSIDLLYPFLSKLIRICHRDPDYFSYTEIPIECRGPEGASGGRVDYNLVQAAYLGKPGSELAVDLGITSQEDVLYAVFAQSKNESDVFDKPNERSALCVYSMRAIHRKFTQNIQHCFSGNGDRGLNFINPSVPCVHTQLVISDDFCGTDVNTPLGGEIPVVANPVITFQSPLLTSVAAISTHDYTVGFLGTNNGHLLKVVIESSKSAFLYSDLEVDRGSPVNPDLLFDTNKDHIYVMTERKLTRLKVQECNVYKSCSECLGAKDPYCGWCSLENKCSLRSECAQASQDPLYWLSYRSGKCTTITNVQPAQIQRTTARTLQLTIDNLPTLMGQFVCVFTAFGKPLMTNATRTAQGVSCPTPRTDTLPPISPGLHHFTAKLSVKNWNGPEFVATNFTFYDCNTYSSCTQCVSSLFPCDWCVDGHRCTHDTGENCRNDILVTGLNNIGPSIRSGPGFCPRINATSVGGATEILVPYESVMKISVKVDNMAFIMQTRFVCQFNIEGRVKQVSAQLLGDTIYCDHMEFKYISNSSNITATFAVIWGGSKPLDNPDNIHVLVYRCSYMADNCGLCLALPEKYQCGWCQSSDKCQVTEQCDGHEAAWLNRHQTCPDPRILDFFPKTGPLEGGTKVTIRGINLGKTFDDIRSGVTVAGHQCIPIREGYVRTSQIICEIKPPDIPPANQHKGPVIVKVQDSFRGESDAVFTYVNPVIKSIYPTKGPQSGGTVLNITGDDMNAGSHIDAFIALPKEILPCRITKTAQTWAECITSRSDKIHDGELRMKFDSGERTLKERKYRYVADPRIVSIESGPLGQKGVARGIPSGGIVITVNGSHFDAIQKPKIYVIYDGDDFASPCIVETATEMRCKSPRISKEILIDAENPKRLELGFIMDDVTQYHNYTLFLFPNPKYLEFEEHSQVKYYKSDYLTINGENLDRSCKESDVVVEIGTSFCNVTSLSRSQLTCRPPTSQPPARSLDGTPDTHTIPEVVVIVGGNLRYKIGYLSYESPVAPDGGLSRSVIIGVIVGGGILLIIVIAILIAYRRKSTESNRVLKNMQEQMDVLELRVAAECKEAFAELQTEMTDLTSDLTSGGIPFLDYRAYAMKILFPMVEDHPVLRDLDNLPVFYKFDHHRRQMMEKGLKLYGQLIMNKTFLLLFIRTLECNVYFSMRDRVNVASLIMVTLQNKMEYCTDILKTLLAELIEKCIEGKTHPKLLLRRTESVAEKMLSAWFTFLLYKFMKECAGEPLFMLYRAIKQQVDKGPVDAITSEARYSLSEEKLIRQQIEYNSMTVMISISPQTSYVTGLDPQNSDCMEQPVKILDCDTISQVKEKALDAIYKATPFSQRPSKDDLDLEWRTGISGRLILSDEDNTTKIEGEWKKLNTLAHYKVQEGAQLTLVPKQSSMYNLSILSEKSEKSHKYETLNFNKFSSASPPLSRATSPLNHDPDSGYKYWHLVKHHDTDATKEGDRGKKMVSEIYLTRLLATKGTLQKFVDDLFETIFSTAHRGSALPLAIKYMFDFLDDQALQHGITDPEVVHTWKSNSLPLRFWVNLIKNPNFVFDIYKSNIVDSCLSVVAQTFMDSCSTSDHQLGKDSPSSKLLYAKDIPSYKKWVERYYQDIKLMSAISDQDMNAMLAEESRIHLNEFNTNCALYELYTYAIKYNDQLIQILEEDEFSRKNKLAYKLEHVHSVMAGESEA